MPSVIIDDILSSGAMPPNTGPGADIDPDFKAMVNTVLMRQHVSLTKIGGVKLEQLYEQLWAAPDMVDAWGSYNNADMTLAEVASFLSDQMFNPKAQDRSSGMVDLGISILRDAGRPLNSAQEMYSLTGSNLAGGSSELRQIIIDEAQKVGIDPALALATAWQESGLNPAAIGDGGHSVGLFQLNDQGEGYGMSVAERQDPRTNARIALAQFAAVLAANPGLDQSNPGLLAAMAQRPADPSGYAASVNDKYGQVKGGKLPNVDYNWSKTQANQVASEYPDVVSAFQKYYGRKPNATTIYDIAAHGQTAEQRDQYIRSMPSHMSGLTIGQYSDFRGLIDSVSSSELGHPGTDGIVRELWDSGMTNPALVKAWYLTHTPSHIDSVHYNAIYQANQGWMQGHFNETGFDPRIATAQYNAAAAAGTVPPAASDTATAPIYPPPDAPIQGPPAPEQGGGDAGGDSSGTATGDGSNPGGKGAQF